MKRKREEQEVEPSISLQATWRVGARSFLLPHIVADLLPIVLQYAAELLLHRSATRCMLSHNALVDMGDGDVSRPHQLQIVDDELFVSDRSVLAQNIKVFHFPTGRFLRKSSDRVTFGGFAVDRERDVLYYSSCKADINVAALSDFSLRETWKNPTPIRTLYRSFCLVLHQHILYVKMALNCQIAVLDVTTGAHIVNINPSHDQSNRLVCSDWFDGMSVSEDGDYLLIPDPERACVDKVYTHSMLTSRNDYRSEMGGFPTYALCHGSHVIFGVRSQTHPGRSWIYTTDRNHDKFASMTTFDGVPGCMAVCPKRNELIVADEQTRRLVVFF
jgi:hypothetical protein